MTVKKAKEMLNIKSRRVLEYVTPTKVFFRENIRRKFCVSRLNQPLILIPIRLPSSFRQE